MATEPKTPAFFLVDDCPTVAMQIGTEPVTVKFTTGRLLALEEGLNKPHQTILDELRADLGGGAQEGERPLVRFVRLSEFVAAAADRPRKELLDRMSPAQFQKVAFALFEAYCAAISDLTGAARKEAEQGKEEGGEAAAGQAPESSAPGPSSSSESGETNSPASAPASSGT